MTKFLLIKVDWYFIRANVMKKIKVSSKFFWDKGQWARDKGEE
jgi:hypothetical protein